MKKNKKIFIIIIIILVFSIIFSIFSIFSNKILGKIYIGNIYVKGKTQEDATKILQENEKKKEGNGLVLKLDDFSENIMYTSLIKSNNLDEDVAKAYLIGRKNGLIVNNYKILFSELKKTKINPSIELDDEKLNEKIENISLDIPNKKENPSYKIENEKLIIQKGIKGKEVDKEDLKNKIKNKIYDLNDLSNEIEIKADEKEPEQINLDDILNEVLCKPQDASKDEKTGKITAEKDGIELGISKEEAEKILEDDTKEQYEIPLKITKPDLTIQDFIDEDEIYSENLGTYQTKYDASNINRSNNLKVAAEKLNGTIVNPGEEFSYNKTIGKTTVEEGFKLAKAYSGGKVVLDVGGGICQLSSTLYNSALLANLDITERHNHEFAVSYLPVGRDATVYYGSLDFKFKNERNYPIKIEAEAKNGVVTVSILGIKEDDDYTVEIESEKEDVIPYETEYIEDNSLEKGQEIVESEGEDGIKSITYKILKKNGITISKEKVSEDTYSKLNKVVRRNT